MTLQENKHFYITLRNPLNEGLQRARFKAFLTGFSNNFNSQWKEEDVYGRMHGLSTFERTTRSISIGFKILSESEEEAIQNLLEVQLMLNMLYPIYVQDGGIGDPDWLRRLLPPIVALNFSNLIANQGAPAPDILGEYGYINGLNIETVLESGFVFVRRDDGQELMLPKELDVSFDFTVLHQNVLGHFVEGSIYTYDTSQVYGAALDTPSPGTALVPGDEISAPTTAPDPTQKNEPPSAPPSRAEEVEATNRRFTAFRARRAANRAIAAGQLNASEGEE